MLLTIFHVHVSAYEGDALATAYTSQHIGCRKYRLPLAVDVEFEPSIGPLVLETGWWQRLR